MKNILLLTGYCLLLTVSKAQPPGEWTWMNGTSLVNNAGVFGTQGIPAPLNHPPGLYEANEFIDQAGNIWLHGGLGNFNEYEDMWKYNSSTNEWTWIKGTGVTGIPPTYGIMGVADPANTPGGRSWGSPTWVDNNGLFWLYGGFSANYFSDLWRYDVSTNEWTWISGAPGAGSPPVYGTQGVPSPLNTPGTLGETDAAWVDANNNLWLFGGYGNPGSMGDLWMYNTTTNEWTWMHGAGIANAPPVFGVKGVFAPTNMPGSRQTHAEWQDVNGNFWILGGEAQGIGYTSDMWEYNYSTNQWAWMNGSNTANDPGVHGAACTFDPTYYPASRKEHRACATDACGNFWLYGGICYGASNRFDDLWKFDPIINQWSFIKGSLVPNQTGTFGTIGVSSPANVPPSNHGSIAWIEPSGNFWMFGGSSTLPDSYCDLWRYVPDPNCGGCAQTLVVNFTASDRFFCPSTCIDFTNFTIGATSYQWYFPGGTPDTSTAVNPTNICYYTTGIYPVTLVATNSVSTDSVTLNNMIQVCQQPGTPTITQVGNILFATPGFSTYQWFYGSDSIQGATNDSYYGQLNGNYNLVVVDSNGCAVGVGILNVIFEPDGVNEFNHQSSIFNVFPNPAKSNFTISYSSSSNSKATINIINLLGQTIYLKNILLSAGENNFPVSTKDFTQGIYLVQIITGDKIMSREIIIE